MSGEVWYRVQDGRSSITDWDGEPCGSEPWVRLWDYAVVRHTPRGVWLNVYGRERFVLRDARKRWACPTKEEAFESFRARKQRQAKILCARLAHTDEVLRMAAALADRVTPNPQSVPLTRAPAPEEP